MSLLNSSHYSLGAPFSGLLWVVRILWALTPVTTGILIRDGLLEIAPGLSQNILLAGLWTFWGLGLLAVLLPRSVSLTLFRSFCAYALVLSIWCWLEADTSIPEIAAGFGFIAMINIAVFSPALGHSFVAEMNSEAEKRYLLKPPFWIAYLAAPLAWLAGCVPLTLGAVFLSDRSWLLGGIVLGASLGWGTVCFRSLNSLVRRQLVLVPIGLAFLDPIYLKFSLGVEQERIQKLDVVQSPVSLNHTTLNLAAGSIGPRLLLELDPPIKSPGNQPYSRLLCTPSLLSLTCKAIENHLKTKVGGTSNL